MNGMQILFTKSSEGDITYLLLLTDEVLCHAGIEIL